MHLLWIVTTVNKCQESNYFTCVSYYKQAEKEVDKCLNGNSFAF